ncbi:MAG: hypothetical protein EXR72_11435 [Myxococcales bacterium]|nr:hypothetical protein [Myxococcales bacterium]
MSQEVEIWFDTAPAPAAIAIALERFGALHEGRDGTLRLVEGDEEVEGGVPLVLVEVATPPDAVRRLVPTARATLRASAVLSASRGFWMARMAAEIQRRLGGVVYLPSSGEAFGDVESYERSWPSEHGEHE